MKCMVFICIVLLVANVISAKKTRHRSEDNEKSMKKVFKECQKNEETHVDGSVLKKLRKRKQVDLPENFGDHKLCIIKGIEILNVDDTINLEILKKRVTKKAKDDQDVDAIIAECGIGAQDAKSTAINIDKCLTKNGIDL